MDEPRLHETPDGSLVSPSGETYSRTPERIKRRNGNACIAAGAAVVTEVYPEGLTWFEGEAAQVTWQEVLPRLVVGRAPARSICSGWATFGAVIAEACCSGSTASTN